MTIYYTTGYDEIESQYKGYSYVIISAREGEIMLDSVSVLEELKPVRIYLGLGSNMGDRRQNLQDTLSLLSQQVRITTVSPVYDTAPIGNTKQSRFLNLVCEAYTLMRPRGLLMTLKEIEKTIGREPGPPNSPRPIDIDILLYGNETISTAGLVIPHPRMTERAFVLAPLVDIAPDLVYPVTGKRIKELLKALKISTNDIVRCENI